MRRRDELDRELHRFAERTRHRREHALRLLLAGRALEVDRNRGRVARFIARRAELDPEVAASIASGEPLENLPLSNAKAAAVRQLAAMDSSVPLRFADDARRVSRAVGRLVTLGGTGAGTCFMISRRLLATAGHTLEDESVAARREVEFNFRQLGTQPRIRARFALDPGAFFLGPDDFGFDCTIVALGGFLRGDSFTPAHCPLGDERGEFPLGAYANLVHHPGEFPELVVRENRVVDEEDGILVHQAQTEPGSSGSPLFNDEWEVVAVHRLGRTERPIDLGGGLRVRDVVSQGVRAGTIITRLREIRGTLTPAKRSLLDQALPPPGP